MIFLYLNRLEAVEVDQVPALVLVPALVKVQVLVKQVSVLVPVLVPVLVAENTL